MLTLQRFPVTVGLQGRVTMFTRRGSLLYIGTRRALTGYVRLANGAGKLVTVSGTVNVATRQFWPNPDGHNAYLAK